MAYYRCYCIGANDRILAVNELECESDGAARAAAEAMLARCGHTTIELWQASRRVCRIIKEEPAPLSECPIESCALPLPRPAVGADRLS